MLFSFKTILSWLFYNNTNKLPDEYKDEFYSEFTQINLAHEKIFAQVLFFLNLILIFIEAFKYKTLWSKSIGYRNLFIGHIIMQVVLAAYIFITKRIKKYSRIRKTSIENLLYTGLIAFSMAWSVFAAINAQLIHDQISAYYVCVFCISAFLELQPLHGFIIFIINYLALIVGLLIMQKDISVLNAHIVNITMITVFAYVISRFKFNAYIYNFINKKIIIQKTCELEETQSNLKRLVEQQSQKLLLEMSKRHDMEIEALKAEQKYNENKNILNEKMKYEKLRTDFFANMSHELRTPLNVIFSTNQMLEFVLKDLKPLDNYQKVPRYINIMKQNCYRLMRLINNLIDITKIDSGYFEIFPKKSNIIKLVEDIVLSIIEYAEHKSISITFDTEIEEKIVLCDPDKVERIFLNLLSNAIKFTPPGGRIEVQIFDKQNSVEISVKDTGIGIPKNKQEVIFERFVQVDASLSKEQEGSGIGLSMVKSLVEMHNGTIRLISEEGMGSEFIISLPYKAEEQFEEVRDNEYAKDGKIERIHIEFSDIYF
jgi:signal transduction histidine kinase